MRNSRKRAYLRPQLEPLEARQLLSASVAQASPALVANSSPAIVTSDTSAAGTTIQAATGQSFAGYLGTIKNLQLPGQPDLINGGSSVDTAIVNGTTQSATLNLTVDWGDGTTNNAVYFVSNGDGSYGVFGYHTYASAGSFFPITVYLATSHTSSPANDGTFLPGPDPFTYGLSAFTSVAATGTSSLPQLSAPNGIFNGKITSSTGDGTTSIDWGDGSQGTASIVSTSPNAFDAYASHNFSADGTYLLTFFSRGADTLYFAEVTVTGPISSDPAGDPIIPTPPTTGTSTPTSPAPSNPQAPQSTTLTPKAATATPKTSAPKPIECTATQKFSGLLTQATVHPGRIVAQSTLTIHWGDGTTSFGTAVHLNNNTWAIRGTHTYAKVGHHTITINFVEAVPPRPAGYVIPPPLIEDTIQLQANVIAPPRLLFRR